LEGHVLDYTKFFLPGFVLVLCAEKCHPLVDSMRRWGLATEKGEPDLTIFGMDEGQS
jgi:hypothetical protein